MQRMSSARRPLILASQSPRRSELLRAGGFADFETCAPEVDEAHDEQAAPPDLTLANARMKALKIAEQRPDALVVAADTLVYVDGVPPGRATASRRTPAWSPVSSKIGRAPCRERV